MATCWTCGSTLAETQFTCPFCQSLNGLADLKNQVSFEGLHTQAALANLAQVQRAGFARLQATLTKGFSQLATAIEWGFDELSWRIQQQSDVLKGIDHTLLTPSETQANEYRRMADELKRRGVLDEAEEFYEKALGLNRLDYRTYVGLAETLLQTNRFLQAKEVLERSLPHAPRVSGQEKDAVTGIKDWKSYSLRLIGRIHACGEDYGPAITALRRAVELSPAYAEASYDLAQYAAELGDAASCVISLERAIKLNALFFDLVRRQRAFAKVEVEVKQLLTGLRGEAAKKAAGWLGECDRQGENAVARVNEARQQLQQMLMSDNYHTQDALQRKVESRLDQVKATSAALKELFASQEYALLLKVYPEAEKLFEDIRKVRDDAVAAAESHRRAKKRDERNLKIINYAIIFFAVIIPLAIILMSFFSKPRY